MKIATLSLLTALGMASVGSGVYAVTPNGGFDARKGGRSTQAKADTPEATPEPDASGTSQAGGRVSANASQFLTGSTVKIDGRVAHSALVGSNPSDTYVMLELTGSDGKVAQRPNVSLSLVIDKSGSMAGTRHKNALAAAVSAVERLNEGDSASVVAFDTKPEVVVPLTTITSANKAAIVESIRGIRLGGDTCISCGLDEGLRLLATRSGGSAFNVQRMILLSDGEPTAGVRDVPGFTTLATRARDQAVTITTIGVDVSYNERVMTAIAVGSNGRHYFVENDQGLARVFEAEAQTLTQTVASNAVAELDLAPGVELVQVFDRASTRSGNHLSVPVGSLATGEVRSVLVKIRAPRAEAGAFKLADVAVSYRDVTSGKDIVDRGQLSVEMLPAGAPLPEMDAVVLDRVQKSETAAALRDANSLFSTGKTVEAQRRLEDARKTLTLNRGRANHAAPAPKKGAINKSFDVQEKELDRASGGFATPPPMAAPGRPAMPAPDVDRKQRATQRENASRSVDLGL